MKSRWPSNLRDPDAELPECDSTSLRLVQIARGRNQLLDQAGVLFHHRLRQFQRGSLKVRCR
jgi:hypothetical protein